MKFLSKLTEAFTSDTMDTRNAEYRQLLRSKLRQPYDKKPNVGAKPKR